MCVTCSDTNPKNAMRKVPDYVRAISAIIQIAMTVIILPIIIPRAMQIYPQIADRLIKIVQQK